MSLNSEKQYFVIFLEISQVLLFIVLQCNAEEMTKINVQVEQLNTSFIIYCTVFVALLFHLIKQTLSCRKHSFSH